MTSINSLDVAKEDNNMTKEEIRFFDYDGTLLCSYALSDLPLAELPSVPGHSIGEIPLLFSGWTRTLDQVNSIKRGVDIGAIYTPADGKTRYVDMSGEVWEPKFRYKNYL